MSFSIIKVGVITQNGLIVIMTQLYLTSIKVVYLWRLRIIGCCCCVWRRGREKFSRVVALNRHQINLHVITYLLSFVFVFRREHKSLQQQWLMLFKWFSWFIFISKLWQLLIDDFIATIKKYFNNRAIEIIDLYIRKIVHTHSFWLIQLITNLFVNTFKIKKQPIGFNL